MLAEQKNMLFSRKLAPEDRLYRHQISQKQRLESLKKKHLDEELAPCTFQPNIGETKRNAAKSALGSRKGSKTAAIRSKSRKNLKKLVV